MADPLEFPIGGIDDGVVRLRLRSDADIPWLVEACRDPEIPRWTRVPHEYGTEDAVNFGRIADQEQADGRGLHLIVTDAVDDRRLGSVGIVHLDAEEGRCDLGYLLAPDGRGRGVATRSVLLLSGWIFANLEIERIAIHVEPDNIASRAVAMRAGFSEEGLLRSYLVIKGRRRDVVSYGLLRGEMSRWSTSSGV